MTPRRSGKILVDGLVHQVWKRGYGYCFCVPIALRIGVNLEQATRRTFVMAHATAATVLTCFECVLDPDDPHGV